MEHSALPPNGSAGDVERRVRLMAVLGILLTSFLIGGIATVLLYRSQATTLTNRVSFALELETSAIQAELARLTNITTQITSRTRIRQELERYQKGEISRQELAEFSVPKLADAVQSESGVLGVLRLSQDLSPLLSVGDRVPAALWPTPLSQTETTVGTPSNGLIVVSAPIRNRSMQTVGLDLVMFRDEHLQATMRGFFDHIDTTGSIQIARLREGHAEHFFDIGNIASPVTDEQRKAELTELMRLGEGDGLHTLSDDGGHDLIVAHRAIGGSDWVLMYYANRSEFFATARMYAAYAAATILALALLGIAITQRVIQPLVARISSEARTLQRLLSKNEELLDAVKANESKLQAVIDNAPAVIYIKDPQGKYLLVNSSYERLVDLPREQIIGKFDYQLFPEEIAKSTRDTDLEVLGTGKSIAIDEKAPQADGMHDFLSTKFRLSNDMGVVYGVCGIATDITQRKRIERRLALTQSTVDRANVGVYWADIDGRLIYLNDTAIKSLQLNELEGSQLHLSDIMPSVDRANWKAHWEEVQRLGRLQFETDHRRADGSRFPVEIHANHLAFDGQEFYIAVAHDITARRESESRLRQSATVFDCTAEAIVITDPQGTVLDVNAAFTNILGYSREEVIGKRPSMWKSNLHGQSFYSDLWQSILQNGEWRGEIINRRKDGSIAPELAAINTVRSESGEPVSYVAIYTDISQIKESQQKLAHLAHHDSLTNLPNRMMFNERLQHCLDRAARREERVAVIFVDLDNFKHVNDSLGHVCGDQLLIEVAELLTSALRLDDTVARIGGDEFTILIEEVDQRGNLVAVIEKLIEAFDRDFRIGDATVRVTPSLGISISPDDGRDAITLMRNADTAMYRAKSLGRNTYQFYTEELTRLAFERMRIDSALRSAIARGEFALMYQPQFDLETQQIVGIEALARWHNAELGHVSPEQFIPIAEDNGLILPLGEWILEEACRQARTWEDAGLLHGTLAVNISGVQVRRGDLVAVVRRVLEQTGLPAGRLELEVTESFIMGESEHAIMTLKRLRGLGVTLAVDDFGTGYSSLSYLKSLPIHRLKIDKSFIRDIPEDPNDMAITRAVIALAKSLNLDLVAEGVETDVQRRFLVAEGCPLGQGYLFHRPMSGDEMQRILADQQPPTTAKPRAPGVQ
ncbi:MAG: EAL domain-containing protein [Chromatiaceae bacterium]|nr:EAL domain-containing protein [Chromatiaceae bacterium]